MAKRSGTSQSKRQMMEAVVVISETSEPAFPACSRPSGKRTEVRHDPRFASLVGASNKET